MNQKQLSQPLTHQNLSSVGSSFFKSQSDNILSISSKVPTNQSIESFALSPFL
jgi:hypothetical protein